MIRELGGVVPCVVICGAAEVTAGLVVTVEELLDIVPYNIEQEHNTQQSTTKNPIMAKPAPALLAIYKALQEISVVCVAS